MNLEPFRKRSEIWQSYRNQIFNESAKVDNPLNFNKKWSLLINDIDEIDKSIIASIKFDKLLALPFIFKVNDAIDPSFNNLAFSLDNINNNLIETIEFEKQKITSNEVKKIFNNENDNTLSNEHLKDMVAIENNQLQSIDIKLAELENNVKNFSKNANEKLKSLNELIHTSKNIKDDDFVKIKEPKITKSFNYKKIYFIVIGLLIVLLIVAIALIIYALVQ